MQEEIWKPVKGYEGHYEVSNLGRVKSIKFGKEKIRVLNKDTSGYYILMLCKDGQQKSHKVHQLVAIAFLDHNPCGHKIVVDHIDNNKCNNNANNLQLISQRLNLSKDKKNKYTGVSKCSRTNKYFARIRINGNRLYLGRYDSQEEAYQEYKKALKQVTNKNK